MTHTAILQGFINWTLADESSRKHEFSYLLGQLQLTKCNPAYLKHVLNTYGTTLTIDQGICAEVKETIAHSLILIEKKYRERNIFSISLTRHTSKDYSITPGSVTKIGELPASYYSYYPLCHVTDIDTKVLCIDVFNCALLDLANLTVTPLSSLAPKFQMGLPLNKARAAAVGRKVFFFRTSDKEYHPCLDLAKKKWTMCKGVATSSIWSPLTRSVILYEVCVASVDSAIFMLCHYEVDMSYCNKLMCYDTETDTWSERADLPNNTTSGKWKFAVAINKDIYYVCKNYKESGVSVLCYNTMEEKWTVLAQPQLNTCYFAANIKGMLALGGYTYIRLYDSASDTWESHQVQLPESGDIGEITVYTRIQAEFVTHYSKLKSRGSAYLQIIEA